MGNKSLIIAVLCIAAAFILALRGNAAGIAFLTLIGGSPMAAGAQPLGGALLGSEANTQASVGAKSAGVEPALKTE